MVFKELAGGVKRRSSLQWRKYKTLSSKYRRDHEHCQRSQNHTCCFESKFIAGFGMGIEEDENNHAWEVSQGSRSHSFFVDNDKLDCFGVHFFPKVNVNSLVVSMYTI